MKYIGNGQVPEGEALRAEAREIFRLMRAGGVAIMPFDVSYARMALRDGSDPDPDAPSNARYRQGQEIYLREARPQEEASVIVDNTDLAHPRIVGRT